ncbi:MAG: hypothetical protein IID45_15995 [Planctomycetes bacterium]|nr:hypothetical protein [Planctomycetota bacterium]
MARKIFHGDRLSALLLYAISGADNPYRWCRDAVRTAVIRRNVLRILVRYWFGTRLRVPRSSGLAWNTHFRAFELHAEFIRASHLPLQHTAVSRADDPLPELTGEIMQPLQKHLLQSGFDGMLWQAGYGNPVAGGNFMLQEHSDGKRVWFWIDTETGVPALFALNPWKLVSLYLPRSICNRSPLFDDVDISKLGRYLAQHADRITDSLGKKAVQRLHWLIGRLADCQTAWKKLNRTERGIACFRSMGRITREQANWFRAHPWRWRLHLAKCATRSLPQATVQRLGKIGRWCARIDVGKGVRDAARFLVFERYRRFLSRRFITRRLRSWRERQFLARRQSSRLRAELREEQTALCVADFCVHVAIKPIVKFVEWRVLPLLFVLGVLNAPLLALLISTGGSIARTAYTLPRCVRAVAVDSEFPGWRCSSA